MSPRLALVLTLALLRARRPPGRAPQVTERAHRLDRAIRIGRSSKIRRTRPIPAIHAYDALLADFSPRRRARGDARLRAFRDELAGCSRRRRTPHERVDYLLIRADLEGDWWNRTVLRRCSATPPSTKASAATEFFDRQTALRLRRRPRARSAIARLRACPRVLDAGRGEPHRYGCGVRADRIGRRSRRRFALHHDARRDRRRRLAGDPRRPARGAIVGAAALHAYRAWLDAQMPHFHAGGFAVGQEAVRLVSCAASCCCRSIASEVAAIGRLELARDRALEAWEANRDAHAPSASRQPSFRPRPSSCATTRRALQTPDRRSSTQRADRRHSVVRRAVSHRRGSQSAGRNLPGRLHESAGDVFNTIRRASTSFPTSAPATRVSSSRKRGNRCSRCSGTRASPDTSCSSATRITIPISCGTCTTTACSPRAGPFTARRC